LALLAQQLDVHGKLADLRLETGDQLVSVVGGPALQGRLASVEEGVPPSGEGGGDHAQLPGQGIEVLAPEQAEDGVGLTVGRESATILAVGLGAVLGHLWHSFRDH
jgi:hypothetical protein